MDVRILLVALFALVPRGTDAQAPPAARWFPIRAGAEWSYRSTNGSTRTRAAVADTSIGGRRYVVLAETDRDRAGAVRATRRYPVRLDGSSGRWVRADGGAERPAVALSPCPLPPQPLAVATCLLPGGDSEARHVVGGEGSVPVGRETRDVATRTYAASTGFGIALYADGVGPVLFSEAATIYALESFRPGGDGAPDADAPPVRVWPNPAAGPVTLAYGGGRGLSAEVVDALGRTVLRAALDPGPGAVVLDLPGAAGVYTVRVLDGDGTVFGTARVVRVR